MLNNAKKVLSVLVALIILLSSVSVVWSVYAAGTDVNLELNGGTLQNISSDFTKGDILPNYEQVKKDGAVFGGWYTNPEFTGNQVFVVPADATEKVTYYANWIAHNVNFDNFDSYNADTDLLNNAHWSDWKWPAQNSQTTLNTDSEHALNGGKSMKVCLNEANKTTQLVVVNFNFPQTGDGIAFWVESTNGVKLRIRFNNTTNYQSQEISVLAGKQIVTIPWSQIPNALNSSNLWQTTILVSMSNADDVVYIDEVGTYSPYVEGAFALDTNGGNWSKGYNLPEKFTKGMLLPTMENIEREGATFAGWYDNPEFNNGRLYYAPDTAAGNYTYYARWVKHDVNFSNFEVFKDDSVVTSVDTAGDGNTTNDKSNGFITEANGAGGFYFWGGVAGSTVQLNTDKAYANSGSKSAKLVLKVKDSTTLYNTTQFGSDRVYFPTDKDLGEGIAFWVNTDKEIKLDVQLDYSVASSKITLPAGNHLVTVPWSELKNKKSPWITLIRFTNPNEETTVYIDDIGTYSPYVKRTLTLNTNGGNWVGDYTPPTQCAAGMLLPTMDNIVKDGAVFAGWYDNLGFTNKPIYSIPTTTSGDLTYYARWVKHDVNFSDFEKFNDNSVVTSVDAAGDGNTANDKSNGFITDEEGKGGFYFWGGVANSTVQLNTNKAYSNTGSKSAKLVLKVKDSTTLYNTTQFGSSRVYFPTDKDLGEGIAFWVNTDKEIKLDVQLDYSVASSKITLPAGNHLVTVPWSELNNKKSPWITLIRFTNPNEETTVYIDDIGTYTVAVDNKVTFNTNGGNWIDNYIVPTGYNAVGGLVLPDCNQIKKDGLSFAGWYDNKALTGSPVYSIEPNTTGNKEYWAKWILHDVNFDGFDSYDTTTDMINDNHWSDWKWPAQNAVTTLNTDSLHTYNGGKSMKICPNEENKNDEIVVARVNYPTVGDGIAFWIESTNGATVRVKFNGGSTFISQERTVIAGKRIVTIPWSEISGASSIEYFWQTSILVSVPSADGIVYIDEIGTYKEDVDSANKIEYFTLNGSWAEVYSAPTKYISAGVKLPTYENITKQGYIFAGWYDNKDYSGAPVTVTPESGDIKLYAKWVQKVASYDNFESYTDNTQWGQWTPAATPSLNTDVANAYNGSKSLKLGVSSFEASQNQYATVAKSGTYNKTDDGVYFWIKSEIATELLIAFDDQKKTYTVNVPAGKSFVTIPWSDFTALPEADSFWCMFICVKTQYNNISSTVYVDDIGTYTNSADRLLNFNLNGGSYVTGASIPTELDAENVTILPTDEQIQKEGFFFAGWYNNAELTGVPVLCLKPDDATNRSFWAKWVEQVNINHDFENFEDEEALEKAQWREAETFGDWRTPGSFKLYLEKDAKNLSSNSTKGLRAEYEVKGGGYLQYGNPNSQFRNYSWNTTFGTRGTYREGDGFRFWIKSDKTVTMRVNFQLGGNESNSTKSTELIIPASEDGGTVYLPWSYIENPEANNITNLGFIIYGDIGDKGTVWLDDLGIYYDEKIIDFVAENDDKDIKISGYNNHIPKGTTVQIKKYQANHLETLGGKLPKGASVAYLAEYKLLNDNGGAADLSGPAWVSFKIPDGADISKIGVYEVFFDGSLSAMNYTIEGDWITIYSLNSDGMFLMTMNDTHWSAKGVIIDENIVQSLKVTTSSTISKPSSEDDNIETDDNQNIDIEDDFYVDFEAEDDNKSNTESDTKPLRGPKRQPLITDDVVEDDGANWWIIASIAVGATLVIVSGIIIFLLIKRRQRKNNGGAK